MSDMLKLAKGDLAAARLLSGSGEGDEVLLNYAGYHCSQAAEKLIKFCVIEKGVIPPRTRKIIELFNFMENKGIKDETLKGIDDFVSIMLDSWSTDTRYIIGRWRLCVKSKMSQPFSKMWRQLWTCQKKSLKAF
jgi:HEPN domain-containing protein